MPIFRPFPFLLPKQLWLEKVFNLAAQKLGFKFVAKKFPGGTILLLHVEEKEGFPAQFGREVLAGLLNMADNADWRNCRHSKQEEMKIVEDFKNMIQAVDYSYIKFSIYGDGMMIMVNSSASFSYMRPILIQ